MKKSVSKRTAERGDRGQVFKPVPTNLPVLHLSNIYLTRAGRKVLQGVNWTVKAKEHWFILGPNGSGKTSLLEVVMGYLWATRGTVQVMGETYGKTNLPELRKKIGYVAPWVPKHVRGGETVIEVVAAGTEGCTAYHDKITPALRSKVRSKLRQLGCLNGTGYQGPKGTQYRFEFTPFENLSSGEQLKVGIARALMAEPKVLILDEPFSALDMGARFSLYGFLSRLARSPKAPSLLLVTHHLEDILPFFTHGLILKAGKFAACGEKKKVLTPAVLKKVFGTVPAERYQVPNALNGTRYRSKMRA